MSPIGDYLNSRSTTNVCVCWVEERKKNTLTTRMEKKQNITKFLDAFVTLFPACLSWRSHNLLGPRNQKLNPQSILYLLTSEPPKLWLVDSIKFVFFVQKTCVWRVTFSILIPRAVVIFNTLLQFERTTITKSAGEMASSRVEKIVGHCKKSLFRRNFLYTKSSFFRENIAIFTSQSHFVRHTGSCDINWGSV